jgi:uncharacterized protein (DUF1330 family)
MTVRVTILTKITDADFFRQYLQAHLPTVAQYGGEISFRSLRNQTMLGPDDYDVVIYQTWPNRAAFDTWYQSPEYQRCIPSRDAGCELTLVVSEV